MSSDSGADVDADVVVTVHTQRLLEAVAAGVERAGQGARVAVVCCPDVEGTIAVLAQTSRRGARGLPVLGLVGDANAPFLTSEAVRLLTEPALSDLHVAVPTIEIDEARRILWDQLRVARIEERHQLVEVDGRSAAAPAADLSVLAAAAAGILAGRMAAGNRAWAWRKH